MELFLFATFLIMVQSRLTLLTMRGYKPRKSIIVTLLSFIGAVSSIAIIVFGFMNFEWWIPIVSLLGMSFVAHPIVNRATALFFRLEALTDIIITLLCMYMWFI